jgi:hypothetical protein
MAGRREDAQLLVELAKWGAMIGLGEASRKVFSDDFDPDTASARDPDVQPIVTFFETLGTLVKNDLFDRDLALDWVWVKGAWDRVGPAALRAREAAGAEALFENFEALAQSRS